MLCISPWTSSEGVVLPACGAHCPFVLLRRWVNTPLVRARQ
jgi:hypothetical protein